VAWTLRDQPHLGVARGLAFYQLASATADWVMWIVLADQGIFSTTTGRVLVLVSIPTHYLLGVLLVRAIRRTPTAPAPPLLGRFANHPQRRRGMGAFGAGGLSWAAGVGEADLAAGGEGAVGLAATCPATPQEPGRVGC
jgi:hypothetical protein